ncbi:MAG: Cys-Xaa-Xaa-Xaa repeat radical SAM target protein [Prevotella sp.]|nr:Cys-Xaa-Xaa-Xaa repeat radical SAM target protein [Prevotella sp.]
MKTKKKNAELQSRRDFFKKAAKSALPILGAVVLAGIPNIQTLAEQTPMGCSYNCSSTCQGTCDGTCRTGCQSTCYTQCYSHCKNLLR